MLAAAIIGLLQAGLVGLALEAFSGWGVRAVAVVPVVAVSTFLLVLFLGLVRSSTRESSALGGGPAAAILEVVAITTPVLRDGLTPAGAQLLAEEAQARLGYAAIAVSDRGHVLAHVGLAADHHGAGTTAPPGAVQAMDEERVARLPAGWRHGCTSTCPLRSAVVGPLIVRGRAVGSIIAFSEGALEISDQERAVMESLCGLVSNALAAGEVEVHARASASAELAALQAQIEPHFLFNALNTILASRDNPEAIDTVTHALANYLRFLLRPVATLEPLSRELDALEQYLTVQTARFGDGLVTQIDCELAARGVLVPPVMVQPLVENALKYGAESGPRPLRLEIAARREGDWLVVEVANTGRWALATARASTGTGLDSLERRLKLLIGSRATLTHAETDGWVRVRIRIPVGGRPEPGLAAANHTTFPHQESPS
jgi:two-component system sensor histidine kinase LytS